MVGTDFLELIEKKCKNTPELGRIKVGDFSRCYDMGNAFKGEWRKTSFVNYDTNNIPSFVLKTLGNDTLTFAEIINAYEETFKIWQNSQPIDNLI